MKSLVLGTFLLVAQMGWASWPIEPIEEITPDQCENIYGNKMRGIPLDSDSTEGQLLKPFRSQPNMRVLQASRVCRETSDSERRRLRNKFSRGRCLVILPGFSYDDQAIRKKDDYRLSDYGRSQNVHWIDWGRNDSINANRARRNMKPQRAAAYLARELRSLRRGVARRVGARSRLPIQRTGRCQNFHIVAYGADAHVVEALKGQLSERERSKISVTTIGGNVDGGENSVQWIEALYYEDLIDVLVQGNSQQQRAMLDSSKGRAWLRKSEAERQEIRQNLADINGLSADLNRELRAPGLLSEKDDAKFTTMQRRIASYRQAVKDIRDPSYFDQARRGVPTRNPRLTGPVFKYSTEEYADVLGTYFDREWDLEQEATPERRARYSATLGYNLEMFRTQREKQIMMDWILAKSKLRRQRNGAAIRQMRGIESVVSNVRPGYGEDEVKVRDRKRLAASRLNRSQLISDYGRAGKKTTPGFAQNELGFASHTYLDEDGTVLGIDGGSLRGSSASISSDRSRKATLVCGLDSNGIQTGDYNLNGERYASSGSSSKSCHAGILRQGILEHYGEFSDQSFSPLRLRLDGEG